MNERTKSQLSQYHHLKTQYALLGLRLDNLKEQIKLDLEPGEYKLGTFKAQLQVRDRTTLIDKGELDQYMWERGFLTVDYSELRPCPTLIEQLYLEGRLNDSDLRAIRKPQYSIALRTEEIDVQIND